MKTTLFLGAGASVFAGIPTMEGLSKKLYERLNEDGSPVVSILHDLFGKAGIGNIEDVYACLESLPTVKETAAYNLLKNLTLYTDDKEEVEITRIAPDPTILQTITGNMPRTEVEKTRRRKTSPPQFSTLVEAATDTIKTIRNVLNENVAVDYTKNEVIISTYDEILGALPHDTAILTTNYDNIIEKYCEQVKQHIVLGFVWNGHANVWRNDWSGKGRMLVKIHGSILWKRDGDKIKTHNTKAERDMSDDVMIYPTQSEKTYKKAPFYELFLQAKKILRNTDLLIVLGFSFRDKEINKIIRKRLDNGMKMVVFGKDAEDVKEYFKGLNIGDAIDNHIVTRNLNFMHGDLGRAMRLTVKMVNDLPK